MMTSKKQPRILRGCFLSTIEIHFFKDRTCALAEKISYWSRCLQRIRGIFNNFSLTPDNHLCPRVTDIFEAGAQVFFSVGLDLVGDIHIPSFHGSIFADHRTVFISAAVYGLVADRFSGLGFDLDGNHGVEFSCSSFPFHDADLAFDSLLLQFFLEFSGKFQALVLVGIGSVAHFFDGVDEVSVFVHKQSLLDQGDINNRHDS
jgi:hypothetical protein